MGQVEPMVVAAYVEELTAARLAGDRQAAPRGAADALRLARRRPGPPLQPRELGAGHQATSSNPGRPRSSPPRRPALSSTASTSRTLVGLRDRAFLGVLVYSFARVSAAVSLRVADYYTQGRRSFFRLHEKGGRYNVVPAYHVAQEYVDAYLEAARIGEDRRGPLFRSCESGRRDVLQERGMSRVGAFKMIKRRARSGRATGRDLRPQLPRDRDHRAPAERRRPQGRGPDRGGRIYPHHAALQSSPRGDLARRDRTHPHLNA